MSIDVSETDQGYVLCVGLSLEACSEVARLVKDRAVVVAAADTDGARALLGRAPVGLPAAGPPDPSPPPRGSVLQRGPLRVDLAAREVTISGRTLHLSPREFDLLAALASEIERVWSFAELTTRVWHTGYLGAPDVVTSAVKRLRKRLDAFAGLQIASVRGIGYRLVVSG
ncbi:MAG TPA: winged helix-turn-helix domain-containing protein [Actinotalea caeni]|uniref:winged helix-turn-helix domain-containing protein n=1 Tax=Actinotalea caeni TaxID=1348467 RepID=UPI002B4B62E2|nr:winged helix-turn-helix domain-containing protein [Actinotalea caeni]HLV55160.1 winged helix-turn-helix domain-containing protein [Actinotalea caeni]